MDDLVREAAPLYERRASFWKRLSALLRLKEPVYGPIDLAESLGEGLTLAALDSLVREGYLKPGELAVVAPPRTLTHRRHKGERLRPDESERLARHPPLPHDPGLARPLLAERSSCSREAPSVPNRVSSKSSTA